MKNKELWKERRWLWNEKKQRHEPDLKVIYPGSVHIAWIQIQSYVPLIKEHMRGHLLDCGCDVVPYYGIYKDLVTEVTCIDWETTREKNPFVDLFANLNAPLPFADNSFDSVFMTDVLTHILQPERLFTEFSRILKPGGKIFVTHAFNCWMGEPPYEYGRYSEYSQRIFCEQNGLTVIHLEPYGGRADVLLDTINKGMTGKWRNRIFRLLRRVVISTSWYKNNAQRTGKRHPIGYVLVAQKQ